MEQMQKDIEEAAQSTLHHYKNFANEKAEYHAEVYASSKLGLEDGEEKQKVKDQYVELFLHTLSQLIFKSK